MNYIITGGTGFIGTHLTNFIKERHPDAQVYNLDIVKPVTPTSIFETNMRGAENVCAFAEKWGIKRIVFTSSIAPYGAAEELKDETTQPTPNTPYSISKLVAEKIHQAWQKGGTDRHLTIVRPGVVFGKSEKTSDFN